MMRRRHSRAGFTLLELALAVVAIALVIAIIVLFVKVNKIDERGRALTAWIGQTDGPQGNAAGGLTTYLIEMRKTIHDHIELKEPGNTVVHCVTCAPDNHLDPPPPPNW